MGLVNPKPRIPGPPGPPGRFRGHFFAAPPARCFLRPTPSTLDHPSTMDHVCLCPHISLSVSLQQQHLPVVSDPSRLALLFPASASFLYWTEIPEASFLDGRHRRLSGAETTYECWLSRGKVSLWTRTTAEASCLRPSFDACWNECSLLLQRLPARR